MRFKGLPSLVLLPLLLTSCGGGDDTGPLRVSVIGPQPRLAIPDRAEPAAPQAALLLAAAQGLVSFDSAGQIEAGLAERWKVSDDGMSFIFRLRTTSWSDGRRVTAEPVAAALRAAVAKDSGNRLAMLFGAIDTIVAVTPQVIEIRLKAPRPLLLPLLAQPEMGVVRRDRGSGPYRIASTRAGTILLEPLASKDGPEAAQVHYPVLLSPERAALALVRFKRGDSAAVLGGSFLDLPVARAANLAANQLRFDPAQGLFGLAIVAREGFLSTAENRNALAMAIDRDALVGLFGVRDWRPALSILPRRLDMAEDPALPNWAALNLDVRRTLARSWVGKWSQDNDGMDPELRIALPQGPGAAMLFARLSADLDSIGIKAVRVGMKAAADLQLVDSVSPSDSATWYLRRLSCANGLPCSRKGDDALLVARDTLSIRERGLKLKEAEVATMANMPFIPIASPLRWSAVSQRLTGFQPNARAVHPLGRLLKE